MNRLISRSLVVALALFLTCAGIASAAGSVPTSSPAASAWALVMDAWTALSRVWQDERKPAAPAPTADSDGGSHLDPFG